MLTARDVMDADPTVVSPGMRIEELGRLLVMQHLEGVCVVENGRVAGVTTAMDLIFQEKRLHLPAFVNLLDALIPLELPGRTRREMRKISGVTVADVMTSPAVTARPDTPLDELATLMVEQHVTIVPVLDGERLVGVVSKSSMLRTAFPPEADDKAANEG